MSLINPYSDSFQSSAFCGWLGITAAEFERRWPKVAPAAKVAKKTAKKTAAKKELL